MSLPGLKLLSPAPRSTRQRTPRSRPTSATVPPRARHMERVNAFSFSSRSSVRVPMSPVRANRISSAMASAPVEQAHEPERGGGHVGDEKGGEEHGDYQTF